MVRGVTSENFAESSMRFGVFHRLFATFFKKIIFDWGPGEGDREPDEPPPGHTTDFV